MIGLSNSKAGRAAFRIERNRWISPRQVEVLDALWSARLRRAGRRPRPERSREERLRHIAEIVGHAVTSSRDLSWREANRVIHRLLEEVRSKAPSPPEAAAEESGAASRSAAHHQAIQQKPGKRRPAHP